MNYYYCINSYSVATEVAPADLVPGGPAPADMVPGGPAPADLAPVCQAPVGLAPVGLPLGGLARREGEDVSKTRIF